MGPYPFNIFGRGTLSQSHWDEQQAKIAAFDAGKVYAPAEPDPDPPAPAGSDDGSRLGIVDLSVAKARQIIGNAHTLEFLDTIESQERANEQYNSGRKSVLASIEKKRAEIQRKFT